MSEQIKVKNCEIAILPKFGDDIRGQLTLFEANKHINFGINRVYYIYNVGDESQVRGPHAHKKNKQIFLCINGSAKFHVDDGKTKQDILINESNKGVVMYEHVWHSITEITKNAVILVAASEKYDKDDYLLDYDEFINYVKSQEMKK